MTSPFPGMDPFIEGCGYWGDFHGHLIDGIYRQLAEVAPKEYVVRTAVREYLELIEEAGEKRRPFIPDVRITSPERRKKMNNSHGVAIADADADAEALTMQAFFEELHREAFVEIYSVENGHRLITCIELLSPTNKKAGTKGRKIYSRKRHALMRGDVNFIEIDLLRGGQRMRMIDRWPSSPYTLLVARAGSDGACRVWPAYSLKPLTIIPVPLKRPDADLSIDLQPLIDSTYRLSRYGQTIDYRKPIEPPLLPDEQAWLKKQLRSRKSAT